MKMQVKPEAAMDNFLAVLGLWRKPVARDGFCLFRAVSEQVKYHVQPQGKLQSCCVIESIITVIYICVEYVIIGRVFIEAGAP